MATLKDVASESGLAVSTVSRILNNRGYISDTAREKVDHAMAKLHYQPNEVARSLCKKIEYDWCNCSSYSASVFCRINQSSGSSGSEKEK